MRNDGYSLRNSRSERILFCCYLGFFLLIAISIAAVQPLLDSPPAYVNPPDEHSRIKIPLYIAHHLALPSGAEKEVMIDGYGGTYALLPGLPYIFMGLVMRISFAFSDAPVVSLVAGRLVNVACGVLTAVTVYFIGNRVFRTRAAKWLFASGFMFLPQQLYLHTYINTDSMCMAGIALTVLGLLILYEDSASGKSVIVMSVGLIFILLTYYNAYGYVLLAVFLVLAKLVADRGSRAMLRYTVSVILLTVAGAGWWFIRNAIHLRGDIFGLRTLAYMQQMGGPRETYYSMGKSVLEMFRETQAPVQLVTSFIGRYGSMRFHPGKGLITFWLLFFSAGLLLELIHFIRTHGTRSRARKLFHAALLATCLITVLLWLYYCYYSDFQAQGRYIMPIALPLLYYVCAGYESFFRAATGKVIRQAHRAKQVAAVCSLILILVIAGGTARFAGQFCAACRDTVQTYAEQGIDVYRSPEL